MFGEYSRDPSRWKVEYFHAGRAAEPTVATPIGSENVERARRLTRQPGKSAWVRSFLEGAQAAQGAGLGARMRQSGVLIAGADPAVLDGFARAVGLLSPRLRWIGAERRGEEWACLCYSALFAKTPPRSPEPGTPSDTALAMFRIYRPSGVSPAARSRSRMHATLRLLVAGTLLASCRQPSTGLVAVVEQASARSLTPAAERGSPPVPVPETVSCSSDGPALSLRVERVKRRFGRLDFRARYVQNGSVVVDDPVEAFVRAEEVFAEQHAGECNPGADSCTSTVVCVPDINLGGVLVITCSVQRYAVGGTVDPKPSAFNFRRRGHTFERLRVADLFLDPAHARRPAALVQTSTAEWEAHDFQVDTAGLRVGASKRVDNEPFVAAMRCPFGTLRGSKRATTLGPPPVRETCPSPAPAAPLALRVKTSKTWGFPKRQAVSRIETGIREIDRDIIAVVQRAEAEWRKFKPSDDINACGRRADDPCVLNLDCRAARNDGRILSVECFENDWVGGYPNHSFSQGLNYIRTESGWTPLAPTDLFIDPDGADSRVIDIVTGEWDGTSWFALTDEGLLSFPGYRKHAEKVPFAAVEGELTCATAYLARPSASAPP